MVGEWDLRGQTDTYFGGVSFAGKRVLELGTASGYLCFEMEARGADVVAFDLAPDLRADLIPLATADPDIGAIGSGLDGLMEKMRNSYWFCHRLRGSKAKVVYGDIYALPAEIGTVDLATFGSILLHLRDPFLALANAARFAREAVVVTEVLHEYEAAGRVLGESFAPPAATPKRALGARLRRSLFGESAPTPRPADSVPAMVFLPDPNDSMLQHRLNSWWRFTPTTIERMLAVLGFADSTVTTHWQKYNNGHRTQLFTVVARRTAPMPRRVDGPYPWY